MQKKLGGGGGGGEGKKGALWEMFKTGNIRKEDDDGSENVGKTNEFAFFQTYNRVYLDPLNMSNAGNFSWSLFRLKKIKENSSSYVRVLHKRSN